MNSGKETKPERNDPSSNNFLYLLNCAFLKLTASTDSEITRFIQHMYEWRGYFFTSIDRINELEQEVEQLKIFEQRMKWLHQGGGPQDVDRDGYEWGVARVKFDAHGQVQNVLWTDSDSKDLDMEMQRQREAATRVAS